MERRKAPVPDDYVPPKKKREYPVMVVDQQPHWMTTRKAPIRFHPKLAEYILEEIANGRSLPAICREENMPSTAAVFQWAQYNVDENGQIQPQNAMGFNYRYTIAVRMRASKWAEELHDIADDASNDFELREGKDGKQYQVVNNEVVQRSKLRVDTRKWMLSKLLPKVYGDTSVMKIEGLGDTVTTPPKIIIQPVTTRRMIEKEEDKE